MKLQHSNTNEIPGFHTHSPLIKGIKYNKKSVRVRYEPKEDRILHGICSKVVLDYGFKDYYIRFDKDGQYVLYTF